MKSLVIFVTAFVVAGIATPIVAAVARRVGRVAAPGPNRWHVEPTALFGGVGIFVAYAAVAAILVVQASDWQWFQFSVPQVLPASAAAVAVLAAGVLMFLAGLVDDLIQLRPPTKLVLQAFAAALLASFGVLFEATPWPMVNVFVTLVWFVAITNAFNLLDNMDGVAAGVSVIAGLAFTAFFSLQGHVLLGGVSLTLAAACAGFLLFNFHPARIFMGDAGSMMLGATFAGLGAVATGTSSENRAGALAVVLLFLIVPCFDTALVTLTRTLARHPIAVGGRDHASHRLATLGLSDRAVALLLYSFGVMGAALGLVIAADPTGVGLWSAVLFLIALMMVGAYLARVYTYPSASASGTRIVAFLVEDLLYRRRLLEVGIDVVIFGAAYWGAYLLRWDGQIPPSQQAALVSTLGLAAVSKSLAFVAVGVYRGLWQQVTVADVHRLLRGALLGGVLTAAVGLFLFPNLPLSRSVFLLDAGLVLLMAFGVRLSFRSLDRLRYRVRVPKGVPTLIYGAGRGGDLAVRELIANPELGLVPVGFVDDDPRKKGVTLHGLPVHSGGAGLDRVLREQRIEKILIGTRALGPERLVEIEARCAAHGVSLLELRVEVVDPRLTPRTGGA